ncbi:MAG TPA: electron transfer flavoprotein-ubiquinone oxidoreductase [Thiobacillus sp.]|nr:MAG: electron transfer flavoprotein-ubiquinone oxidoreductase [Hydrogenophilales bacterium 16-64-40]OZA34209.1 MAG: electron transfer flavoprotein-ubiquinone oxidoreductase [Hydrogenophilales bacterium 17-64-65]HQS82202.1 electron transfer flavoprotein-ubiquinone oxidoreductase [Thiobacillus sp.]HQT32971.1 electron transfer flavoprotein-ubiquinone oxidoreductase [Thiobacillus sp.]
MSRDVMSYDVLIVGAGPAGLAAALRLKQIAQKTGQEISVCVLEKGAQLGAHILSGAVIDPVSLNELLPDWDVLGAPLITPVSKDEFVVLGERGSWRIPVALLPPLMANHGAYIISLGEFCQWLGSQAEAAGVEIYAGYAAQEILYGEQGEVAGIITGDMGRTANGEKGPQFAPGIEIHARYTLIAEGVRGSLTRDLEQRFQLRKNSSPQKYGLGIKEVWRVAAEKHRPGLVQHSLGWPLAADTGGGSFIYHYGDGLVSIGFVVHLDYANPHLSPFDEFQRFKMHPAIRPLLEGGKRLSYGARAITEGGLQSWPELVFPGGALIGCSAGMVNVPRIKGIHNAMKSGMLAAEAVMSAMAANRSHDCLGEYPTALRNSRVWRDLHAVRNVKPMLSCFGTTFGTLFGGVEMWLAAGGVRLPWTLRHQQADHERTCPASEMPTIDYPNPDGKISFDKLSSVALSNITHDRDQPCHLHLLDKAASVSISIEKFDAPEQRYCPAGVYEIVVTDKKRHLQINAQNCIHCKTCDIKDALQNIVWKPPEGGSGPVYSAM